MYKKQGSLLPPPIHVGKHLRERQCDFHLSYDIWWQLINDLVKLNTPHHDGQIVALYAWPAYPCTNLDCFYEKCYRGVKIEKKIERGSWRKKRVGGWDGPRWREIFENLVKLQHTSWSGFVYFSSCTCAHLSRSSFKALLISFCFRRNLIQLSCMCSEIDVHLFCSKIFILLNIAENLITIIQIF